MSQVLYLDMICDDAAAYSAEYALHHLSEWTGYDTPEEDDEELLIENNVVFFNDETLKDFKTLLKTPLIFQY